MGPAPRASRAPVPSQGPREAGPLLCPPAASGAADEGQGRLKGGPQGPAGPPPSTRGTPSRGVRSATGCHAACAGSARRAGSVTRWGCCPQVWRWPCGHLPLRTVLNGLAWPLQAPRTPPPTVGPARGQGPAWTPPSGKAFFRGPGRAAPQPGPVGPEGCAAFTPPASQETAGLGWPARRAQLSRAGVSRGDPATGSASCPGSRVPSGMWSGPWTPFWWVGGEGRWLGQSSGQASAD